MKTGEFQLIEWIRGQVSTRAENLVELGIGDDCAVIRSAPDGRKWLVTTDMLLDGRHFELASGLHTAREVGRKAMGVNLSDIAAMAGSAVAAFVSVALPEENGEEIAHELTAGLREMADLFGVSLAGGDTNRWNGPLVVNVTVLGLEPGGGAVLRSGAKLGDYIYVTGPLGGSFTSGRHMKPFPRLKLGQELKQTLGKDLHAMIDLSDGLGGDLRHILEESGGVGAVLRADQIPVHKDVLRYHSEAGEDYEKIGHALGDGEDFELCFCVDPGAEQRVPAGLHRVGVITEKLGVWLENADGDCNEWRQSGFDHFRKPSSK